MAYDDGTTLQEYLENADKRGKALKFKVISLRDDSAAGNTIRRRYRQLQRDLQEGIDELTSTAAILELVSYAKTQKRNDLYEFDVETTALIAAAATLRDWIHANYPTGAGSADLSIATGLDGTFTDLTFTTAQTVDFRTECNAFLAAITS